MPVLSNLISTSALSNAVLSLFGGVAVQREDADSLVLQNDFFKYDFSGSDFDYRLKDGLVTALLDGTFTGLTIREAGSNALIGKFSGLNLSLDDLPNLSKPAGAAQLAQILADMDWRVAGTVKANAIFLDNPLGFHSKNGFVLDLLGGNDTARGGDGNDRINAGYGDDVIYDSNGNDRVYGGGGKDRLGESEIATGNDSLFGGGDNDFLFGGRGNDRLFGENGSDQLFGGAGRDTLSGGIRADTLTGDGGADIFVFASGDGNDVVTDFDLDADRLRVTGEFDVVYRDGDAILRFASGRLIVENVAVDSLVIGDHIFVA